jgi:hypothetical protein
LKILKALLLIFPILSRLSRHSADFVLLRSVSQAAEAKLKADLDGLGALREPGKAAPNIGDIGERL